MDNRVGPSYRPSFHKNGDPDRVSCIVEVKSGKQVVMSTLPPIRPF